MRVSRFAERVIKQAVGQYKGKPFFFLPWQWELFIAPLFGWKRPDGTRRFRRFGLYIPKKNGKTALVSVLMLYLLTADGEPEAEIYSCAADRRQAKLIYIEAERMVKVSPVLQTLVTTHRSRSSIRARADGSFYEALSADVETKDGPSAHAVFFDELHTQTTRKLWAAMRYAGRARRQPLLGWITTAGRDINRLWYEELNYAKAVASDEVIDTSFLPLVFETDENADWESEETWAKANPSMGSLFTLDAMRESYQEIKRKPPMEQLEWRRLLLNQIVRVGARWISPVMWTQGNRRDPQWPSEVYGALDVASSRDLNAFTLGGWLPDGSFVSKTWYYCHEAIATEHERKHREMYLQWHKQGHLIFTPGNCTDWEWLYADLHAKWKKYRPKAIAVDPYNAGPVLTRLAAAGAKIVQFNQRPSSYNAPCRELERLVYLGKHLHEPCPITEWMISNTLLYSDKQGNVMPDRERSTDKIDGVATNLMVLGLAIKSRPEASIYEERGL